MPLGGTYTVLSAEVQRPYANRLLYILNRTKKAPKLPPSVVPVIVTGFNALGQNHEIAALLDGLNALKNLFGELEGIVDTTEVSRRVLVGFGAQDVPALILSDEQKSANAQGDMQNQAALAAAPEIAKGAVGALAADQGEPA